MKTQVIHTNTGKVTVRYQGFLIPQGRLVRVNYYKDGILYGRNIVNPKTNSGLQLACLGMGIAFSQVSSVESVKEIAPNGANSENYVETFLARVNSREVIQS